MNNRGFRHFLFIFIGTTALLMQCNSKTTTITTTAETGEKTDECLLKEEVCKEAFDFQKEYERMSEEAQKDMVSVLSTYVTHCEEATAACEKSKKGK